MRLYGEEGIATPHVEWLDSAPAVQLIGRILSATDDTWRLAQDSAADQHLLQSLHATHGPRAASPHPRYRVPRIGGGRSNFAVLHYAEEVPYQVAGFCKKNKGSLSHDLRRLLSSAASPWLRDNQSHLLGEAHARQPPGREAAAGRVLAPLGDGTAAARRGDGGAPDERSPKMRAPSVSEHFRSPSVTGSSGSEQPADGE